MWDSAVEVQQEVLDGVRERLRGGRDPDGCLGQSQALVVKGAGRDLGSGRVVSVGAEGVRNVGEHFVAFQIVGGLTMTPVIPAILKGKNKKGNFL